MNHHHDHDHDHDHDHHHDIEMTFEEKLLKLLDHWCQHNEDHAKTYNQWAEKVKQNHMEIVAALIDEAAEMNLEINKKFEQAKALVQNKG